MFMLERILNFSSNKKIGSYGDNSIEEIYFMFIFYFFCIFKIYFYLLFFYDFISNFIFLLNIG